MVELTRRWFVFGTAAAVAAAAIPAVLTTPIVDVPPLGFRYRLIRELVFCGGQSTRPSFLSVIVRDQTLLSGGVGPGGSFFWRAMDGGDIIVGPTDTMRLDVADSESAEITLISGYKVDDGPPIWRQERHIFPQIRPPEIGDLYPDNSLEARLERETRTLYDEEGVEDFDDEDFDDEFEAPR